MVSIPKILILIGLLPMLVYSVYWLASPYENCLREGARDRVKYENMFERDFTLLKLIARRLPVGKYHQSKVGAPEPGKISGLRS